jgi:hypothetical protein
MQREAPRRSRRQYLQKFASAHAHRFISFRSKL